MTKSLPSRSLFACLTVGVMVHGCSTGNVVGGLDEAAGSNVLPSPLIATPTDGALTNNSSLEISGLAQPGSTVTVLDGQDALGTAEVDDSGRWALLPTNPLADGEHSLTALATDPEGNESASSAPVALTVDSAAPDAPVIVQPTDGEVSNQPQLAVVGTAEPLAVVNVAVDDTDHGSTAADADGGWTLVLAAYLPDGSHGLVATASDAAGNASAPSAAACLSQRRWGCRCQAATLLRLAAFGVKSRLSQGAF